MGRGKSRVKNQLRTNMLCVRIGPETKLELHTFADSIGLSVSALVYANIKHVLRQQRVDFSLPGESIPMLQAEKAARQKRSRDFYDSFDWSKVDPYDS